MNESLIYISRTWTGLALPWLNTSERAQGIFHRFFLMKILIQAQGLLLVYIIQLQVGKWRQTWASRSAFPLLEEFYGDLETSLNAKFLQKKSIYRPFLSLEDQNDWIAKQNSENTFIEKTFTVSQYSNFYYR